MILNKAFEAAVASDGSDGRSLSVEIQAPCLSLPGHPRVFNKPTVDELAIVFSSRPRRAVQSGFGPAPIVLEVKSSDDAKRPDGSPELVFVDSNHPSADSLAYPIIFPTGMVSWCPSLRAVDVDSGKKVRRVTALVFYRYLFLTRTVHNSDYLLSLGRLTEKFLLDSWVKVEENQFSYLRNGHAKKYRQSTSFAQLSSYAAGDSQLGTFGRRIRLPASFTCSPRYYRKECRDSLALATKFGMSGYFITFTASSDWPEFKNNIEAHQTWSSRCDLIARVFMTRVYALKEDLFDKGVLGKGKIFSSFFLNCSPVFSFSC